MSPIRPRQRAALAWLAWLAWLLSALAPGEALAEPRFAVREGVQCAACHVNQTGGGMRTPYGASFSQTNLGAWQLEGAFDPALGGSASVGANLRLSLETQRETQTSLGGDSWEAEANSSFEIPEGNVYLRVDPVPDHLTIYLDETVAPEGASAREAFVLLHDLPAGGYIKAGRFMLPYGLRLQDDDAFIRKELGFTYANQDLGVELGLMRQALGLSLAVTNGSGGGADPDLRKQYTASATLAGSWIRGGTSVSFNDTSTDDTVYRTLSSGGHLGLRLGRALVLGEVDWVHGVSGEDTYDQVPIYTGVDFEAWKSLYLRFAFEAFDPLLDMEENERDRFVAGVSFFPVQLLELRAEYRLNRDIPQRLEGNVDELFFELHGFL